MELTLLSIFPCAVVFLSLTIPLVVYIRSSYLSTQKKNLPPGSMGLPIIGESLSFLWAGQRGMPEKFVWDRMAKFSSQVFKTSLFGEPTIVFCGSAGNKFLFMNENKLVAPWWPSLDKLFPPPKGDGLSASQKAKDLHSIFQSVVKPEFFSKYIGIMDKIAQRHFASSWSGASQVQVFPLAKRYTFWVASSSLLGIDDPEEVAKLAEPFDVLSSGLFTIPIDLPGMPFNRAIKASKTVRKQLQDIIKQRKLQLLESTGAPPSGDILSHMIGYEDQIGQHLGEEYMANYILGLLIAGHDTTSSAITFIVKYLAEFPQVYDEVFREQMEILKLKAPEELLNWDDIRKMKYSWNVACEVMRLVPPIPGSFKQATKDFNYAGFSIPEGWKIYWSAHTTHRNPDFFPDPEKFDPSRFNNIGGFVPYSFIPFGGGPRTCPGKEYARLELLVFVHNIVKRYKWEKMIPNEKMLLNPFPKPANGLPVELYPRKY